MTLISQPFESRTSPSPAIGALDASHPVARASESKRLPDAPSAHAATVAALPPPAPPSVTLDERTLQVMASFAAEVTAMGANMERFAAARDVANTITIADLAGGAASGSTDPVLAAVRDGGLHYFIRLRLQDEHSGAAELRRLAQGAMHAQQWHLDEQQNHGKAALALAEKMKPQLALAHTVSCVAHTCALAAGCAVGAVLTAGAVSTGGVLLAGGLTLGLMTSAVVGAMYAGGGDAGWLGAAGVMDAAAAGGLLLMAGAQTNPVLWPMLVGSRLVDAATSATTSGLQNLQDSRMREAEAWMQAARLAGTVHDRGYSSCMEGVQRISQSHSRALSIVNAMLRSSQQVMNLQIRNLRR